MGIKKSELFYFPLFPLSKKIQEVLDCNMYIFQILVEDEIFFSRIWELSVRLPSLLYPILALQGKRPPNQLQPSPVGTVG